MAEHRDVSNLRKIKYSFNNFVNIGTATFSRFSLKTKTMDNKFFFLRTVQARLYDPNAGDDMKETSE